MRKKPENQKKEVIQEKQVIEKVNKDNLKEPNSSSEKNNNDQTEVLISSEEKLKGTQNTLEKESTESDIIEDKKEKSSKDLKVENIKVSRDK